MELNQRSFELAGLIVQFATRDGVAWGPLKRVRFFRSSKPTSIQSVIYEPSIILVAQGRKQAYLAGNEYTYDPKHYLITSVPLPVHSRVRIATPEEPFLSMSLIIEPAELSALIMEMDEAPVNYGPLQSGISVSAAPEVFFASAIRLLQALREPMDAKILAPLCIREMLYHALKGPQGHFLRAIALRQGHHHRIAHVLNLIHTKFDESLEVPVLAEAANMSVSTFHQNFKEVTSLAPLQYVKTIRLHKARSLMLYDGISASQAAFTVGYASPSQFSREFRRLFGLPPMEEVSRMRAAEEVLEMG